MSTTKSNPWDRFTHPSLASRIQPALTVDHRRSNPKSIRSRTHRLCLVHFQHQYSTPATLTTLRIYRDAFRHLSVCDSIFISRLLTVFGDESRRYEERKWWVWRWWWWCNCRCQESEDILPIARFGLCVAKTPKEIQLPAAGGVAGGRDIYRSNVWWIGSECLHWRPILDTIRQPSTAAISSCSNASLWWANVDGFITSANLSADTTVSPECYRLDIDLWTWPKFRWSPRSTDVGENTTGREGEQ